jgi:hypothetical protein
LSVDAVHDKLICDEEIAVADNPAGTVGAVVSAFTVRLAALLVAVPAVFVTTTRNVEPLSVVVAAGVV